MDLLQELNRCMKAALIGLADKEAGCDFDLVKRCQLFRVYFKALEDLDGYDIIVQDAERRIHDITAR